MAVVVGFATTSGVGEAAPLRDRLTLATETCRKNFIDESLRDANQIVDPRNGYARVSGSYPTCGCTCSSTAAAFRAASGKHHVLAYHEEACEWSSALAGGWKRVLPADIWSQFAPQFAPGLAGYTGEAVFGCKKRVPAKKRTLEQYTREAGRWAATC